MPTLDEPRPRSTPPHDAPENPAPPFSRWLIPALFILFAAAMAVFSTGFLEPDEITHFLRARAIWSDWTNVLDLWGRFGANLLFGLAAPFGIMAARLVAVAVTLLTGLALNIMVRHFISAARPTAKSWFARHATAFAWLLFIAQPCVALNSFTVMTEMLLACSWAWTFAILISRQNRSSRGMLLASLILGLGGLMRPEGWLAIAAWPLFTFLWLRRADTPAESPRNTARFCKTWFLAILLAGLPTLLWFLLGIAATHDTLWVIHGWPWSVRSPYGASPRNFLLAALASMALWLWLPVILGIASLWSRNPPTADAFQIRRLKQDAKLCLVAPLVALYLVHALLGNLGLFGSMSLPRYFIPVAPMAAVLALLGLIAIERQLSITLAILLRALTIALPITTLTLLALVFHWLPMLPTTELRQLNLIAQIIQQRLPASEIPNRLIVGHPYSILILNLPLSCPATTRIFSPRAIASAPTGTLLITDASLWYYENRPTLQQLTAWGYQIDPETAAKIDALPPKTEPFSIEPARGKTRLWIKQQSPSQSP